MTMRALFRYALLLFLLLMPEASYCQQEGFSRAYTKKHPLIYEDAWDLWPYVFLDDEGNPTGYNVELIEKIFQVLDIPYEIHLVPTHQALDDLREHKSDLMLGMMANYHDDYSQFYGDMTIHMFTHSVAHCENHASCFGSLSDLGKAMTDHDNLVGNKVIVHDGSFSHHLLVDSGYGQYALPYADMDKAVQMVSAEGRGHILWNTMSLKWLIYKYHANNIVLSPVNMPSGDYRFMSNDSVLLKRIEETYARLKATEQLQPLDMKWFYPEDPGHTGVPKWLWYVAAAIGIVALMLTFVSVAYYVRERRVTRDSRMRNARLAFILKTCQVRMWTYDVNTKTITWYGDNARPSKTYTMEEFSRRYSPEEFARLKNAVRQLLDREQDEVAIEMHVIEENDGNPHTYSVVLSFLKSTLGSSDVIIGTKRDITEEHEQKQYIDSMMKRYQALFKTAIVDMIFYDKDGFIANMNENAQKTFNMQLHEVHKINVEDWLDSGQKKTDYIHMTQFLTPDGRIQPPGSNLPLRQCMFYETQLVPIIDTANHSLGIYATGRDVTEMANSYRKAKENIGQLKNALGELANYVDNLNYIMQVGGVRMMSYSPDTHMLTINHRMHKAQYVLTQQRCLAMIDESSMYQAMRMFRAMDRKKNMSMDSEIKTKLRVKGNKLVCLYVQLFPVFDADGNVTEYNGICRDTTEIKHTEMMLQLETEKAQVVEQLKNQFLHNMCEEIRTPLDIVVANAENFNKEHTPEDEATFIEAIKINSAYLLNLINDILFLSRLDARMVEFSPLPCDFSKTFESHCIGGWNGCKKEGVKYVVENHYEKLVVDIDDINIGRIIEQLVKNAAEHTDNGMVRARYEYIGGKLIVIIEDTGEGIDKETMEHIFERFNTNSAKYHRTGLGMPICKELAAQMNGTIEIESKQGRGTTVWLTIPCEATASERKKDI